MSWWIFGATITALDLATADDFDDAQLNMLINLGLMRLALVPIERHIVGEPIRLVLLALFFAAANPWISAFIEYGTNAWLFALLGLL